MAIIAMTNGDMTTPIIATINISDIGIYPPRPVA